MTPAKAFAMRKPIAKRLSSGMAGSPLAQVSTPEPDLLASAPTVSAWLRQQERAA